MLILEKIVCLPFKLPCTSGQRLAGMKTIIFTSYAFCIQCFSKSFISKQKWFVSTELISLIFLPKFHATLLSTLHVPKEKTIFTF